MAQCETAEDALEWARKYNARIRIWYGDTETGKAWDEEHHVLGKVGQSTGSKPIRLLINNARSMGGPAILEDCIVRIDVSDLRKPKHKWVLYQHPKFDAGTWFYSQEPQQSRPGPDARWQAFKHDGEKLQLIARFKTEDQAKHYCEFMVGDRYAK